MAAYNFRHPRRISNSKSSASSVPPQQPPEDTKKNKMKRKEFLQFLAHQFPSQYSSKKAAAATSDDGSDGYETIDSVEELEIEKQMERVRSPKKGNITTVNIIMGRGGLDLDDDDSDYDEDDESFDSDDSEDDDEKEEDPQYDEYITMIRQKKFDSTKERQYFKGLKPEEKTEVLARLKELETGGSKPVPPRIAILRTNIPLVYKSIALEKMASMKNANGGELHKLTQWMSGFMSIPLGKYIDMPVNLEDHGVEQCSEFMNNAKATLDRATYGLNDAKSQIMQWLGKAISNRTCSGTVIGVHGPMGTGKTTLLSSVSKILGDRPFHLIALGGATDSSYLEGHLITYEGSTWGHIVECLRRGNCMNPVFFFDELDKISDTAKGAEIIGILTHLTDPSQNSKFFDKFFSVELDLSRAIFVFSYNDKSKVEGTPLGDRMFKIETAGYSTAEKIVIAESHLIPSVCADVNFKPGDVVFPRETLTFMIENYTGDEKGVRNLKRCVETVVSKLNLYRIMRSETKQITGDAVDLTVTFPYSVPISAATAFLKSLKQPAYTHMYM